MKKNKIFKSPGRFYLFSGICLFALVTGTLIWNHLKHKIVNKKLYNLVAVKSKGLYQLQYSDLHLDEALGNITADHITLLADSQVYQSLADSGKAPDLLLSLTVAHLFISGVSTPKALLNKEIKAHAIKLVGAEIEILLPKSGKAKRPSSINIFSKEFYEQILGNLKSIDVDSIILENGQVKIRYQNAGTILYSASGLNIRLEHTTIDELTPFDSTHLFFSRQLSVNCRRFESVTKKDDYHFQINDFVYQTNTNEMDLGSMAITPRLSETAFTQSNRFAKDRFDLTLGKIKIQNINITALNHQKVVVDQVELNDPSLYIFRDISLPHDSVDRTHDFPQEVIKRLPMPLYIHQIQIRNGFIEYKEKNNKSDSSGRLTFYHINAAFRQVTNMPIYIKRHNELQFEFRGKFLNESNLTVHMNMLLNDTKGHFQLEAKLDSMDALSLNPLLKPMALAEIENGQITGLQYSLSANNTFGQGNLLLTYQNLKLKLLKKSKNHINYQTRLLPTIAANVVIKKSNPLNGKIRLSQVEYTRDTRRSLFNFLWKSLLAGIKKTAL